MKLPRTINRANLLGIIISGLGLAAFASWSIPEIYSNPAPVLGAELSFLEEWWKAGQGKGFPWQDREPQPPTVESVEVDRLIVGIARPGFWNSDEVSDLSHFILEKSEEYGVSPFLILSLIDIESGFRPSAVSRHGAVGLMQLRPDTAAEVALHTGLTWHPSLLVNPKANIELGLRYMSILKRQFGSEEHALTAYNIGPTALREKLELGEDLPLEYFRLVKSRMLRLGRRTHLPRARARTWAKAWL